MTSDTPSTPSLQAPGKLSEAEVHEIFEKFCRMALTIGDVERLFGHTKLAFAEKADLEKQLTDRNAACHRAMEELGEAKATINIQSKALEAGETFSRSCITRLFLTDMPDDAKQRLRRDLEAGAEEMRKAIAPESRRILIKQECEIEELTKRISSLEAAIARRGAEGGETKPLVERAFGIYAAVSKVPPQWDGKSDRFQTAFTAAVDHVAAETRKLAASELADAKHRIEILEAKLAENRDAYYRTTDELMGTRRRAENLMQRIDLTETQLKTLVRTVYDEAFCDGENSVRLANSACHGESQNCGQSWDASLSRSVVDDLIKLEEEAGQ